MAHSAKPVIILLADDDAEDREMTRKALEKNRLANDFYTVADGEELLDFLHHRGAFLLTVHVCASVRACSWTAGVTMRREVGGLIRERSRGHRGR